MQNLSPLSLVVDVNQDLFSSENLTRSIRGEIINSVMAAIMDIIYDLNLSACVLFYLLLYLLRINGARYANSITISRQNNDISGSLPLCYSFAPSTIKWRICRSSIFYFWSYSTCIRIGKYIFNNLKILCYLVTHCANTYL